MFFGFDILLVNKDLSLKSSHCSLHVLNFLTFNVLTFVRLRDLFGEGDGFAHGLLPVRSVRFLLAVEFEPDRRRNRLQTDLQLVLFLGLGQLVGIEHDLVFGLVFDRENQAQFDVVDRNLVTFGVSFEEVDEIVLHGCLHTVVFELGSLEDQERFEVDRQVEVEQPCLVADFVQEEFVGIQHVEVEQTHELDAVWTFLSVRNLHDDRRIVLLTPL